MCSLHTHLGVTTLGPHSMSFSGPPSDQLDRSLHFDKFCRHLCAYGHMRSVSLRCYTGQMLVPKWLLLHTRADARVTATQILRMAGAASDQFPTLVNNCWQSAKQNSL